LTNFISAVLNSGGQRFHAFSNHNIGHLIRRVVKTMSQTAELRNIELTLNLAPDDELWADIAETLIESVIRNLLSNAVKFTGRGGQVAISARAADDTVVVEVADSGIGIPVSDHSFVFEAFYQVPAHLSGRVDGLGLGLSVARDFVEYHGGRLEMTSVEGNGSVFRCCIPTSRRREEDTLV
jgi:signal transduction histidine kinase